MSSPKNSDTLAILRRNTAENDSKPTMSCSGAGTQVACPNATAQADAYMLCNIRASANQARAGPREVQRDTDGVPGMVTKSAHMMISMPKRSAPSAVPPHWQETPLQKCFTTGRCHPPCKQCNKVSNFVCKASSDFSEKIFGRHHSKVSKINLVWRRVLASRVRCGEAADVFEPRLHDVALCSLQGVLPRRHAHDTANVEESSCHPQSPEDVGQAQQQLVHATPLRIVQHTRIGTQCATLESLRFAIRPGRIRNIDHQSQTPASRCDRCRAPCPSLGYVQGMLDVCRCFSRHDATRKLSQHDAKRMCAAFFFSP